MHKLNNFLYFVLLFFFNAFLLAINIDGNLSEEEWQQAEYLDNFLTVFPNDKSAPEYKTKIKYFSNEKGIYIGIINEQPLSTQVSQKHPRDSWAVDADRISLIIDFNANANIGYEFTVSLGDSLRDAIWVNENDISDNWDAIWQAKTSQSENEWFVEYFLPWGIAPMSNVNDEYRKIKLSVARKVHHLSKYFNMPGLWVEQSPFCLECKKLLLKTIKMKARIKQI
mgnify:FL=1